MPPTYYEKRRSKNRPDDRAKAEEIKLQRIGNLRPNQCAGNSKQEVNRSGARPLCRAVIHPFNRAPKLDKSLIDLLKSKQRAAVAVAPGLGPTDKASGAAPRVTRLLFEVIDPFSKIEPDDGVITAVALRLGFIAIGGQWRGSGIGRAARDNQRGQQIHRARR